MMYGKNVRAVTNQRKQDKNSRLFKYFIKKKDKSHLSR